MTNRTKENRGGGAGKVWCEDYGEVVLYLSVRKGEIHEYITHEDLIAAKPGDNGNITIFVHEGAYFPEDYDHYTDFSYAHYIHTRRYEVTMPIDVLRDKAMRGLMQYRAAYRELIPRDRYPSMPSWMLEAKRELVTRPEGNSRLKLVLAPGERVFVSAKGRTIYDPSIAIDLFHRVHAVYRDGCLWPGLFHNPMQFWDALSYRSKGGECDGGLAPFSGEVELTPIDPATMVTKELLFAEPKDRAWVYGGMCDYLALSDIAHLWGIDIVCLGSGVLPSWWERGRDGSYLGYVEHVPVFGEEYPGCRSARFVRMGTSLASHRDPERPCFILKMHNRVSER